MAVELMTENNYCTGCKACLQACKDFYNLSASKSLRTVTETEQINENGILQVTFQSNCEKPCRYHVCVTACPLSLIKIIKE